MASPQQKWNEAHRPAVNEAQQRYVERNRAAVNAHAREYARTRVAMIRARRAKIRKALDRRKLAAGCADCGYAKEARKLHWHHRPGTVKCFEPSAAVQRSEQAREAELAKCDVLCASCHAHRHG